MRRSTPLILLIGILVLSAVACRLSPFSPFQSTVNEPAAAPTPSIAIQLPAIQNSSGASVDVISQESALTALYERVNPGVVAIQVISDTGGSQGSGFVFDTQGHIVTNYHVVEGATDLEVDFPSGLKVRGKVVGTDLDSDLAVVKVDAPADQLFPLPLGSGESLKVGQTVIAIGNPFGLSSTMTVGIISAKGRTMEGLREAPQGGFFSAGDVIQTDAAINPGNSGGPLLNLNGEVVGVNRAILTNSTTTTGQPANSGVGFAVNVDIVSRVVPFLIKDGKYDYPYLGMSSREELSLMESEALGLTQTSGAYILEVRPGSPAEKAGLQAGSTPTDIAGLNKGGDLIVAVDGRPVRVFGDLLSYLMTRKGPGDSIVLTILRDGQQKEVTVELGKRP